MSDSLHFTVIGLGKYGGAFARLALEKGYLLYGINNGPIDTDLERMGLQPLERISQIRGLLRPTRVAFLFVADDRFTDGVLESLAHELEPGDIVIDGSDSQWRDSIVRHRRLKQHGLHFVDLGVTGDPSIVRQGTCLIAGGDETVVHRLDPLLRSMAAPGGFVHAGPPGSGHFAKSIHDEIERDMRNALLHGLRRLELHEDEVAIERILSGWRNGSEIQSRLLDRLTESYRQAPHQFSERIGFAPTGPEMWKPYPH